MAFGILQSSSLDKSSIMVKASLHRHQVTSRLLWWMAFIHTCVARCYASWPTTRNHRYGRDILASRGGIGIHWESTQCVYVSLYDHIGIEYMSFMFFVIDLKSTTCLISTATPFPRACASSWQAKASQVILQVCLPTFWTRKHKDTQWRYLWIHLTYGILALLVNPCFLWSRTCLVNLKQHLQQMHHLLLQHNHPIAPNPFCRTSHQQPYQLHLNLCKQLKTLQA